MSILAHVRALLAPPGRRRLARWRVLVENIAGFDTLLRDLNDQRLHNRSLSLRYRAKSGEPLDRLLPEAFALVAESAARTLGMRHFPVQYLGGIAIHRGGIAEMETGEGKTLTATLPLFLNALSGRGAHLATANDYLAVRDADWMRPVFNFLGMTVGAIRGGMSPADRRDAYHSDVTGRRQLLSTSYQARVQLDAFDDPMFVGAQGQAKIAAAPQSLASRLYRYLSRTFHFEL
jgi:preprotein translocase subunit SecA